MKLFPTLKRLLLATSVLFLLMGAAAPLTLKAQTSFVTAPAGTYTNTEVRKWYNDQVATIAPRNLTWEKQGLPIDERAFLAWGMRHNARVEARKMMSSKREVRQLQRRDRKKYGNPDGPTFDYLVDKNKEKGLEGKAIYQSILESSQRTNKKVNEEYQGK